MARHPSSRATPACTSPPPRHFVYPPNRLGVILSGMPMKRARESESVHTVRTTPSTTTLPWVPPSSAFLKSVRTRCYVCFTARHPPLGTTLSWTGSSRFPATALARLHRAWRRHLARTCPSRSTPSRASGRSEVEWEGRGVRSSPLNSIFPAAIHPSLSFTTLHSPSGSSSIRSIRPHPRDPRTSTPVVAANRRLPTAVCQLPTVTPPQKVQLRHAPHPP
jgi:hypothetical protein